MSRVRRLHRPPEGWSALCARDPHATLFLGPAWMDVMTRAYPEFRPGWLIVEGPDRLLGVWPFARARRKGLAEIVSLPFGTHGGPILDPKADPAIAGDLANAFRDMVHGFGVVRFETTVFDPPPSLAQALQRALGAWARPYHTHVIDLRGGFDALWAEAYDKESRTCVRKAERAGVEVRAEAGADAVAALHAMHVSNSRNWSGARPHARSVIEAALGVLGDDARIWVARRNGEPLVANLTLYDPGSAAYPWIAGATPGARPVRANHLLNDRMLRDACARGFPFWNFGGSAGNPGIEAFKESMGARPRPVHRFYHEARWRRWLRGSGAP